MNQDKIGKFIYELRTERNLSQYQLADMIPISRQAISKWERGETIPDSSTLVRLSEIFNVTINELLKGERLNKNSIEQLEKTTLNILDENNKNSKKIKRNFKISFTIILVLAISFLSYYFINSYNSVKVYTVSGENDNIEIREGVLLITKSKVYLKMGNITNHSDKEIVKMKMYYKNKKKTIICEDKDIQNYTVIDQTGYKEKEIIKNTQDINALKRNSYIEITYSDNSKEIIKLVFKRNFTNSNIMFKNNTDFAITKNKLKDVSAGLVVGEIGTKVEKKEEVKEEIKIEENVNSIKEEMSSLEKPAQTIIHDSTLTSTKNDNKEENNEVKENNLKEIPKEEVLDISKILDNLKATSFNFDGTYIYENEEDKIMILYYESLNQLTTYLNDSYIWDYYTTEDRYNCSLSNSECKKTIIDTLNKYFK